VVMGEDYRADRCKARTECLNGRLQVPPVTRVAGVDEGELAIVLEQVEVIHLVPSL
jgi:hypothetical protein